MGRGLIDKAKVAVVAFVAATTSDISVLSLSVGNLGNLGTDALCTMKLAYENRALTTSLYPLSIGAVSVHICDLVASCSLRSEYHN